MKRLLIKNIGLLQGISAATTALRGADMARVESLPNAWLAAEGGVISGMPYAPARRAMEHGCAVALASDWNPGSSPSGSMPFVQALIRRVFLKSEAV